MSSKLGLPVVTALGAYQYEAVERFVGSQIKMFLLNFSSNATLELKMHSMRHISEIVEKLSV